MNGIYLLLDEVAAESRRLFALLRGFFCSFLCGEVEDADVADLEAFAVTAEADEALLVEEAWMAPVVYGVGV